MSDDLSNIIMSFFSKKKISYIGVDIGSATIKMIEIKMGSRGPQLVNYGFAEKMNRPISNRTEDIISESATVIKKIYHDAGFTSKNVVAALHNFDVFTSIINVPKTFGKELENIIKVEAHKFVPIPLEDVVLDWKVLSELIESKHDAKKQNKKSKKKETKEKAVFIEKSSEGLDVLLTAAPRKLVKKYVDIFKAAELNLLSLETESFAFIRALLDAYDATSLMIVDIGAVAVDIIIVENQVPIIIRTIEVGGSSITLAIERNLGITSSRAEQFKRDVGLYAGSNKNSENHAIIQLMESTFVPVVNEINYSLDLYKARNKPIEKIILSGGSAHLLGITDFFKSTFGLPVYIGDPWHKLSYPEELRELLTDIGPMFTVAVGLALKELLEK